jgi:hypothetical protein
LEKEEDEASYSNPKLNAEKKEEEEERESFHDGYIRHFYSLL